IVLPRASAEPFEPLEPGAEEEHAPDSREVAGGGAETGAVLDEQPPRREHAEALSVDGVVPSTAAGCRMHDVDGAGRCPDRLEAVLDGVESPLQPTSQNAWHATAAQS